MFTDRVIVDLSAGRGGNGVVAWRREKYIPKGGPMGGNGGKGGSVIFEADSQVYSLEWFRNRRILKAENGREGGAAERTGRDGRSLVLKVPCGTLLKNVETGEVIHDFTKDGDRLEICKGGKGGRGNASFKSPTNRAPNTCTEGLDGQDCSVELELKLIADVGLVGFPNAGKSTIVSKLTYVRVKIAAYPFTTLKPNLGYMQLPNHQRLFIADIPGIIEGAHQNKGLGFEFLRHIERTKLLLFVLDASGIDGRDPTSDFKVLRNELKAYNEELLNRPYLVVLNKIDTEESLKHIEDFKKENFVSDDKLFLVSAMNEIGLTELKEAITEEMAKQEPVIKTKIEKHEIIEKEYPGDIEILE